MKIHPIELNEVVVIEPEIFSDARGYFLEPYKTRASAEAGIGEPFVQDNQSNSKRGALRGLHYQQDKAQGKLIRVLAEEIFDVVVDLRRDSGTFGKWSGFNLSASEQKIVRIRKGFGHRFYTLSETAEVAYEVTEFCAPQHDRVILWNDPDLSIRWPFKGEPILSERDNAGHYFREFQEPGG